MDLTTHQSSQNFPSSNAPVSHFTSNQDIPSKTKEHNEIFNNTKDRKYEGFLSETERSSYEYFLSSVSSTSDTEDDDDSQSEQSKKCVKKISVHENDVELQDSQIDNVEFANEQNPDSDVVPNKKQKSPPRKRKRNPEKWKRKQAALLRERGKGYISYKGEYVEGKTPNFGILCKEKCPFQCNEKFNREQREKIFNSFYELDVNAKNAFLFKCIEMVEVLRPRKDAGSHKSATYHFMVKNESDCVRVCKTAFASLFQVGRAKIDHIQKYIKNGSNVPPTDHRGKHMNRPHRITPEVAKLIENHINSFPTKEIPYSRTKNVYKKYLPPLVSSK